MAAHGLTPHGAATRLNKFTRSAAKFAPSWRGFVGIDM